MLSLEELLKKTLEQGASDLHLTVGIPPTIRKNGRLSTIGEEKLMPSDTEAYVRSMLNEEQWKKYQETGELDLSFSL